MILLIFRALFVVVVFWVNLFFGDFTMNVALQLQNEIKGGVVSFTQMFNQAVDLENLYWKGSVSADLGAFTGTDPVTQTTELTKDQLIAILTLAENVRKFFDNVAPSQSDYLTTIEDVRFGTAVPTFVNNTVEAYGNLGVQFARDCLTMYFTTRNLQNVYFSTELASAAGAISDSVEVFGSTMTKKQLVDAITLFANWESLMSNGAVGAADRKVTLGLWYGL
jgi:hypothetical protein